MNRLRISRLALTLALLCVADSSLAVDQIVQRQQSPAAVASQLVIGAGGALGAVCNVTLNTGWISTINKGSLALDWELDRVAATAVTASCETCRTVTGGVCQDFVTKKVPVIVSTSAAGVSTVVGSSWAETVSADTGTTLVVSNAFSPFTRCSFVCTAGGVNDRLSVWYRNITP